MAVVPLIPTRLICRKRYKGDVGNKLQLSSRLPLGQQLTESCHLGNRAVIAFCVLKRSVRAKDRKGSLVFHKRPHPMNAFILCLSLRRSLRISNFPNKRGIKGLLVRCRTGGVFVEGHMGQESCIVSAHTLFSCSHNKAVSQSGSQSQGQT